MWFFGLTNVADDAAWLLGDVGMLLTGKTLSVLVGASALLLPSQRASMAAVCSPSESTIALLALVVCCSFAVLESSVQLIAYSQMPWTFGPLGKLLQQQHEEQGARMTAGVDLPTCERGQMGNKGAKHVHEHVHQCPGIAGVSHC